MHRPTEGRHPADKRSPSTGSKTAHFLRLSRSTREGFHVAHTPSGTTRLKQFLRIARGKTA